MIHRPWEAAFDMPHNREQAIAVIGKWSEPGCMTFSSHRAKRVHECLITDTPKFLPPVVAYGSHLGGWAWGHADGWHGGFESQKAAEQAAWVAITSKEHRL